MVLNESDQPKNVIKTEYILTEFKEESKGKINQRKDLFFPAVDCSYSTCSLAPSPYHSLIPPKLPRTSINPRSKFKHYSNAVVFVLEMGDTAEPYIGSAKGSKKKKEEKENGELSSVDDPASAI